MDVSGINVEKAQEIAEASIVGGYVNPEGYLVLVNGAGAEINAGQVRADAWPVGSIYSSELSTNPNTLLGYGTWVRYGEGRTLVSQKADDTSFDVAGEEGGEKTHTLTSGELPYHTHAFNKPDYPGTLFVDAGATQQVSPVSVYANTFSHPDVTQRAAEPKGQPHNNMPPYKVVYMWKRTA